MSRVTNVKHSIADCLELPRPTPVHALTVTLQMRALYWGTPESEFRSSQVPGT